MSTSQERPADQEKNTYVMDSENTAEMARLIRQDQLLTQGMGGVFPEKPDLTDVHRVLDLACGPGGWIMECADTYTDMEFVGVDISERMIAYAKSQVEVQHRQTNVRFRVMNIHSSLDFPDASFDLVNARFLVGLMSPEKWDALFQECLRLLRPGGVLRFTEIEWGFSNKPHFENMCVIVTQMMSQAGYTYSPTGLHFGIIPMLPHLFRKVGLQEINKMAHTVEFSADTEARDSFYYNFVSIAQGFEALVGKTQIVSLEEWRNLCQKALAEMYEEDFCAMWILLTVWGRKPA